MAAAAMLARMVRQQPESMDLPDAESINNDLQLQEQQQWLRQQEQEGAQQLWSWYLQTVLGWQVGKLLSKRYEQHQQYQQYVQQQQQHQEQQTPDQFSTVTAAALLHATAALGWRTDTIANLTGSPDSEKQLRGSCLTLYEAGLAAALVPGATLPCLKPSVPPIAVVNLVTAMHTVGVKVSRDSVCDLQDTVLIAVLISSSSSSSRVLSYPAVLKLLQSFVQQGVRMSDGVMDAMVLYVQVRAYTGPVPLGVNGVALFTHISMLAVLLLWQQLWVMGVATLASASEAIASPLVYDKFC